MAGFSIVLQGMIRGRIGGPAPSGTRLAPPSAGNSHAGRNGSRALERDHLLPANKIQALLCSYSPKQRRPHGRRVLISAVAAMCGSGLSRQTIYLARRGIMSARVRALLSRAISSIERGEVTFRRRGQQSEAEYHIVSPYAPPRTLALDDSPAAIIERINNAGSGW
jgi:hypothetical protein